MTSLTSLSVHGTRFASHICFNSDITTLKNKKKHTPFSYFKLIHNKQRNEQSAKRCANFSYKGPPKKRKMKSQEVMTSFPRPPPPLQRINPWCAAKSLQVHLVGIFLFFLPKFYENVDFFNHVVDLLHFLKLQRHPRG